VIQIKPWLTWLISPEGPFRRTQPMVVKQFVMRIGNDCGVDIYGTPADFRAATAEYVTLHKAETLFLLNRIHEEANLLRESGDTNWALTNYVLVRAFGPDGFTIFNAASVEHAKDREAMQLAFERASAVVEARYKKPDALKLMPEYAQVRDAGLLWYPEKAPELQDYLGAHVVWFNDIFFAPEFGKWLVASAGASVVNREMSKMMKRARL
jgi:hypothetical protein